MKTPDSVNISSGAEARQIFSDLLTERLAAKALSKAAVVQLTKITPTFVDSLVSGKFEDLPGEVFGRGFVKNICKILGPGNDDLVGLFQKGWTRESKVELQAGVLQTRMGRELGGSLSRSKLSQASFVKKPTVLIALAVSTALLVSLIIAYFSGPSHSDLASESQTVNDEERASVTAEVEHGPTGSDKPAEAAPAAVAATAVPAPAPSGVAAPAEAAVAEVSSKPEIADANGQKPGPDTMVATDANAKLELQVLETVKVRKKIGSEVATVTEMTPQTYNYTVEDKAELLIYDAAAVRIKFGGRDLGELGAKGRVRKLVFLSEKQDKKLQ